MRSGSKSLAADSFHGVHVLVDDDPRWSIDPIAQAKAACRGGAQVIQLRCKYVTDQQSLEWARQIRILTRMHGSRFVMNDRFDLALAADADGVHLGQSDLDPATVAKSLDRPLAIGRSTHTKEQLRTSLKEPIDYVAFGPVFGTQSKQSEYSARGLEALLQAKKIVGDRPLVAIGGITVHNLQSVISAGAQAAAVISAVIDTPDPAASTRSLVDFFNSTEQDRSEEK